MPYNISMIFIETSIFTKLISTYLSDDEFWGYKVFCSSIPMQARLCAAQAVSENYDGPSQVKAKVEVSGLFIIGSNGMMKSGC